MRLIAVLHQAPINTVAAAVRILAGLLAVLGCSLAAAEPLRLVTSELPPLAIEHNAARPGALTEMVEELARRIRQPAKAEFVPWKRATIMASSLPQTAIFPFTRSAERESHYRWLVRLYHEDIRFMSTRGRATLDPPAQLQRARIGVLRGSSQMQLLHDAGYLRLVECANVGECVRFEQMGMVDAIVGNKPIYRDAARKAGVAEAQIAFGPQLALAETWLAGSLDFTEAQAAQFQLAMREMVEDGTYARILKKYDLAPSP